MGLFVTIKSPVIDWVKFDAMVKVDPESGEAAAFLHKWAETLSGIEKTGFIERGRLLHEFDSRRLYQNKKLPNNRYGTAFGSFKEWLEEVWPYSTRDAYASKETYKELEKDLSWEDMLKISRDNLTTLRLTVTSSEHRHKADVIEAAQLKSNDDFVDYMNKKYHLIIGRKKTYKTKSDVDQVKAIKEATTQIREHEGGTEGDAIEHATRDLAQTLQEQAKPNGHANGHAKTNGHAEDVINRNLRLTPAQDGILIRGLQKVQSEDSSIDSMETFLVRLVEDVILTEWTGPEDTQANEAMVN